MFTFSKKQKPVSKKDIGFITSVLYWNTLQFKNGFMQESCQRKRNGINGLQHFDGVDFD